MGMIPNHEELENLTETDLKDRYNAAARNIVVETGFYREELVRRSQQRQSDGNFAFTKQMRNMTVAITVLTVLNVVLVAIPMIR
jgi:hypothetical protein